MRTARLCWSPLFRPHFHGKDCVVCQAAAYVPSQARSSAVVPSKSTVENRDARHGDPSHSQRAKPPHVTAKPDARDASLLDSREAAFERWLALFGPSASADGHTNTAASASTPIATFLDPELPFSAERLRSAVDYLDSFCQRTAPTGTSETQIPIPSRISFRKSAMHQPSHSTEQLAPGSCAFDSAVQRLPPGPLQHKQQLFQRALCDLKRVLDKRTRLRFFLACGTALAAHRDHCFIPHDDDIDIGVFVHDLAKLGEGESVAATAPSTAMLSGGLSRLAVQRGVTRLISDLCADEPLFAPFDVCGDVLRGLEVRFLHRDTNVKVDLNVYYPPLRPEDDALVASSGHFIWHSSFYEQAEQRRFGMYRFRQSPFDATLLTCRFCAEPRDEIGFLVPPTTYLDEYFGPDWRTPRPFTYAEGLDHEYKNIIPE